MVECILSCVNLLKQSNLAEPTFINSLRLVGNDYNIRNNNMVQLFIIIAQQPTFYIQLPVNITKYSSENILLRDQQKHVYHWRTLTRLADASVMALEGSAFAALA